MTSPLVISDERLLAIVEECGLAPIFRNKLGFLRQRIEAFSRHYDQFMTGRPHGMLPGHATVADLVNEYERNPHRVHAFLQALAFSCTPGFLTMVWMVLLGAEIKAIGVDYDLDAGRSKISATIYTHDWEKPETFSSTELWDLAVFRLANFVKADDRPVVSGFFALHVPTS